MSPEPAIGRENGWWPSRNPYIAYAKVAVPAAIIGNDSIVNQSSGLAVKEAVQTVLIDVLGNPKVMEKLRATAPAPETLKRGVIARLTSQARAWTCLAWTKIRQACSAGGQRLMQAPTAAMQHGYMLWAYRKPLLVAVGAGVASGLAAFYAGPWMAATAGTVAGFTAAAAAQLTLTLRRVMAMYTMPDDA